jgi:hypothetical protein
VVAGDAHSIIYRVDVLARLGHDADANAKVHADHVVRRTGGADQLVRRKARLSINGTGLGHTEALLSLDRDHDDE